MSTHPEAPRPSLEGVRVLELPDVKTAPCGRLLADLGADVVLVETPGGSPLRRVPPLARGSGDSLFFWATCAGKRSIALDLRSREGIARLKALAARADVILDPLRPGQLASLGLDSDSIFSANPGVVLLSLTGFGQSGPFRDFASSEIVAWAMSGLMGLTGDPAREPLAAPALQGCQTGALWATIAVLAALYRRRRCGAGARIDISLQEALLAMSETAHSSYLCNEEIVRRARGDNRLACPFRVFKAKDGYASIVLTTQQQWRDLLDWMEAVGINVAALRDPALLVTAERVRRRDEVNAAVAQFALKLTREELFMEGARRGIPNGPVRSFDEVLADEQLASRGFFASMPDPRAGQPGRSLPLPGLPFRGLGARPRGRIAPPPAPGQHTGQVAADWARAAPTPPRPAIQPVRRPLEGIKVVEFCWNIAGPTMGRVLGDLGATVLKVEPRDIGDPCRMLVPFPGGKPHHETSFTFHDINRDKGSITINLKRPASREIALGLVQWADVALESFTPGTMERLGVGYGAMADANQRLVLGSISGYGHTGPRREWPSYHPTSAALSGLTGLFGYEDGEPLGFGHSHMDYVTGFFGVIGVLDALLRREVTGTGDHVDCSQLESGVAIAAMHVLEFAANDEQARSQGNRSGALVQGCYRCKGEDRWIVVTAPDDSALAALRSVVCPGTGSMPAEVEAALERWASARDPWEAFRALQEAGVPAGVVSDGRDLALLDPHLKERGAFARVPHPVAGGVAIVQCPLIIDGERLAVRGAAPILGQDSERVCREVLGLSESTYVQHVLDEVL